MFGVVRGTGGVFRPCGRLVMEGEVGGVFRDTGHGPFRALIVSNLKWGGPCCGHYVFPAGRYQNLPQFFEKPIDGISYFPVHGSAEWPRQGPPPHLTHETFSGRRPVDGADTLGGVFRPGENLTLGAEGKIKSADAA